MAKAAKESTGNVGVSSTPPEKFMSICPEDMTEGGGLLNNIRATITAAKWVMTDYNGRSATKRPAAHLVLTEPDGETHEDQFWANGKAESWMPSEDGRYLIPMGSQVQTSKNTNFGMLMTALLDAGYPVAKMRENPAIDSLVGLEAQFVQAPTGREKKKSKDGTKEYEDTVLTVAEVFKFPWEAAAAKGVKAGGATGGGKAAGGGKAGKTADPAPATTAEPTTAAGGGESLNDIAVGLILQILGEADGNKLPKNAFAAKIMKLRQGQPAMETNKIVQLVFKDDFLGADGQPWVYEGGVVSLG